MAYLLQGRLWARLLVTYLAVLCAGGLALALTVELVIPGVFTRHMANMEGGMGGMMGSNNPTSIPLYASFRAGVNEAMLLAALVGLAVAFVVSILVSRQFLVSFHDLTEASQRIAEGKYVERVKLPPGDPQNYDELGRLGLAFNQMAGRLEKTETMRRQLIGDVSHELRTPLTSIIGSLEGLADGVLPAEEATYQVIQRQAGRLQRLIDDLQELSRVEAGAFQLDIDSIAVPELLETARRCLEGAFVDKGINLKVSIEPHLAKIRGDGERLNQVLTNLLMNALHYTPAGGVVILSARQIQAQIEISVTDNGIGIAPEHLPNLFTRFYRVDKSRSRQEGGGSGIGLTIVRSLIEAHGGQIWASSPGLGLGSTFTFRLPCEFLS